MALDARVGGVGARCPGCESTDLEPICRLPQVPANSCIVLQDRAEALTYPRGDVDLVFCRGCGLVFNQAFEPSLTEYSPRYEETQGWSPTFRGFHERMAHQMIERYGLRGGRVLEIGCGKGEFLSLLSRLGEVRGLGFDPGFRPGMLDAADAGRVRILSRAYEPGHLEDGCDLVCCKMTLEHIQRPLDLLLTLRKDLGPFPKAGLFFMVPAAERILAEAAFEDIYYEHCNYFTAAAMERLFLRAGFRVTGIEREYGGQYLCLHAQPALPPAQPPAPPGHWELDTIRSFVPRVDELRGRWMGCLQRWHRKGRRVAIWGSGSKSLAFLTTLHAIEWVEALIDINPVRQGSWQPGTGLPIRAPESLNAQPADIVVVMNPIYRGEISAMLDALPLRPRVVALGDDPTVLAGA